VHGGAWVHRVGALLLLRRQLPFSPVALGVQNGILVESRLTCRAAAVGSAVARSGCDDAGLVFLSFSEPRMAEGYGGRV
jgi:hypothetical protein